MPKKLNPNIFLEVAEQVQIGNGSLYCCCRLRDACRVHRIKDDPYLKLFEMFRPTRIERGNEYSEYAISSELCDPGISWWRGHKKEERILALLLCAEICREKSRP
jgi:hypothetical protein